MLWTIAFMAAAAGGSEKVERKVKVDGIGYRVEVQGRTVKVFDKSLFTAPSPERGDRMRRAVQDATGCAIKDGYWEAAHLAGILDCPATS